MGRTAWLGIGDGHFRPLAKKKTPYSVTAKNGILDYAIKDTNQAEVHQDRSGGRVFPMWVKFTVYYFVVFSPFLLLGLIPRD
jgi:hypothetical protein